MPMRYFDYETVAHDIGAGVEEIDEVRRQIRKEFPSDDMLYELHVLRAFLAVKDGYLTLRELVGSPRRAPEPNVS